MDLKNQKEFEKLVKFCRKNGITCLKTGDFQIELAREALFPESDYKKRKSEDSSDSIESIPLYSPEQILLWSSEGHEGEGH